MIEFYDPNDSVNDMPSRPLPARFNRLSAEALRLFNILPDHCWMTQSNIAKALKRRKEVVKPLMDELEEVGLIKILFHPNGKRSNPRHETIKLPLSGNPICKHFKNAVCFGEWASVDRDQLVEFYLCSGWNIIPFGEKQKTPVAGFSNRWWQTLSNSEKMDFFFNHPNLNIGLVVCSHSVIIDVESKDDPWIEHQSFQNTLTVSTARGYHFYFRNDPVVTTSTNVISGIDTRGPGNFVVLPPSIHPSDVPYKWELLAEPQQLPIDFRRQWREQDYKLRQTNNVGSFIFPPTIPQGERNDTLWRYGRSLRAQGKDYFEIQQVLIQINLTNCSPSLPGSELEKLIDHVWSHHNSRYFKN